MSKEKHRLEELYEKGKKILEEMNEILEEKQVTFHAPEKNRQDMVIVEKEEELFDVLAEMNKHKKELYKTEEGRKKFKEINKAIKEKTDNLFTEEEKEFLKEQLERKIKQEINQKMNQEMSKKKTQNIPNEPEKKESEELKKEKEEFERLYSKGIELIDEVASLAEEKKLTSHGGDKQVKNMLISEKKKELSKVLEKMKEEKKKLFETKEGRKKFKKVHRNIKKRMENKIGNEMAEEKRKFLKREYEEAIKKEKKKRVKGLPGVPETKELRKKMSGRKAREKERKKKRKR